ncbi:MAG: hypothetical protein MUD10_03185 [Candidatus Pacebacteria bacterium]|nr:hypothetical protein [Candidatus Paceibacterota bacterium]
MPPIKVPTELEAAAVVMKGLFEKPRSKQISFLAEQDPGLLDSLVRLGKWAERHSGYAEQEIFNPDQMDEIGVITSAANTIFIKRSIAICVPG